MSYEAELQFLRNAFQKCHLQTLLVDPSASPDTQIDLGLRKMLGWEDDYTQTFYKNWQQIEPNTIYKLTDQFLCSYMLLLLPEQKQATIMVVGPYLSVDLTHQQIME